MAEAQERLQQVGILQGHGGWVTGLQAGGSNQEKLLVSTSRDRNLYIWNVDYESNNAGEIDLVEGRPQRALTGHSHFISDITLSSESKFALTGSWDNTLRLWDIEAGRTTYRFMGHTKDVLSVTMSPDNRQIISSSRDRTIKLWNTLAECKHTFDTSQHSDWVSSVRFTPSGKDSVIVSAGWDRKINLWS
jgi:guanine nucleotide-binding protein subunit beta-2-like 1 protein